MPLTLKRSSLVAQVADAIRVEILRHGWQEWIPSERELSASLHVSRNTCRKALQVLRREALIKSVHGRGTTVNRPAVSKARSAARALHSVGILIPLSMIRLRPQVSLSIDSLQQELFDLGVRMQIHHSPAYYQPNPQHALEGLVQKNPHDAWVLILSHHPLQRWFMRRGLPCVVSGSLFPGITLPSVDQNNRAICRHAVGKLIALGHRRLVFFNRRTRSAGDLESEQGFFEGVRASSHPDVETQVVYHDDTRDSALELVRRVFGGSRPPTGLLIANPHCYLTVATALARMGRRIPEDVSLISRDNDPFLEHLEPEPARYADDPIVIARKTMVLLRALLEGRSANLEPARIEPPFILGGSCRALALPDAPHSRRPKN